MATFNKFQSFVEALAEGIHGNLATASLKVVLTNTAPNATDTQLSQITQIANGNGYTTGGAAATVASSSQSGGVYKLVLNDVAWTATGAFATFRYAVLYNDTATNDELIGWWDRGSSVSGMVAPDVFTLDLDPTNGALQLT